MNLFKHCLSGSVAAVLMLSALPALAQDAPASDTGTPQPASTGMHGGGPMGGHDHHGCKPGMCHGGMRHGGMHGGMRHGGDPFASLNLTDDQKAKLQASRESFMKDNAADFDKLKSDRMKLMQLKKAAEDKDPNIKAQRDLLRSDFQSIQSKREANLKSILTPDQYKQFEQSKADHRQAWEARRKEWQQRKGEMKNAPADSGKNG